MLEIKKYDSLYEKSWVYCKALSYIFSDFFDDISREKDDFTDFYEDSIELVALNGSTVVGLLDIGIYSREDSLKYPYYPCDKVAYFANFAVHPDYQNRGIAKSLLAEVEKLLLLKGVEALAIFTRADEAANHLYQKWGAQLICRDWLVVGTPKTLEQEFQFKVLREEERLQFDTLDGELPYYQREGHYIVARQESLDLFNIDHLYEERTYLKLLN